MNEPHKTRFKAIGTLWQIDASGESSDYWNETLSRVHSLIGDFDQTYSRFRKDSFVQKIARKTGIVAVPEDFITLLLMYLPLYHLTGGAINFLIGRLLEDCGYDADYSFTERELRSVPPLTGTIEVVDSQHIRIATPVLFDFGAIGKGYLIDLVYELLAARGYREFSIDAGGDIRMRTDNDRVLRIGLEHPDRTDTAIGTVRLSNSAIAGSAGNRRSWGRFHHIIDPRTGTSPDLVTATWVIAASAALADALSTALFFTRPAVLRKQFVFEFIVLDKFGTAHYSEKLPGELFRG
ncbi:MAG: FAD:protein FMN transferase [Patescibacteria group bacterium]|nr:FAD:protein FMN transferase [Patescibacteria group bacterium]